MSRKIWGRRYSAKDMKNHGKTKTEAEFFFEAGLLGTSSA